MHGENSILLRHQSTSYSTHNTLKHLDFYWMETTYNDISTAEQYKIMC